MSNNKLPARTAVEKIKTAWKDDPAKLAQYKRLKDLEVRSVLEALKLPERILWLKVESKQGISLQKLESYHCERMLEAYKRACRSGKHPELAKDRIMDDASILRLQKSLDIESRSDWKLTSEEVKSLCRIFLVMRPFPQFILDNWESIWGPSKINRHEIVMNDLVQELMREANEKIRGQDKTIARQERELRDMGASMNELKTASKQQKQELEELSKVCTAKDKGLARLREERDSYKLIAQQAEELERKDAVVSKCRAELQGKESIIAEQNTAIHAREMTIAKQNSAIQAKDLKAMETKQKHDLEIESLVGKHLEVVGSLISEIAELKKSLEAQATKLQTVMETGKKLKTEFDKRGDKIRKLEDELSESQLHSLLEKAVEQRDNFAAELEVFQTENTKQSKHLEDLRLKLRTNDAAENDRIQAKLRPVEMERDNLKVDQAALKQEKLAVEQRYEKLRQAMSDRGKEMTQMQKEIQKGVFDAAESNQKTLDAVRSELDLVKTELEREKERNRTHSKSAS